MTKEELIKLLINSVTTGGESRDMREELKKYYSLLSVAELNKKLAKYGAIPINKPIPQIKVKEYVKPKHERVPQIPTIPRVETVDEDEKYANELMAKEYVDRAFVIAEGYVGVACTETGFAYAKRLCRDYSGTLIKVTMAEGL